MKRQIIFNSLNDIIYLQKTVASLNEEASLISKNDDIIIDAKTFLGLWTLNLNEPIYLVSENEKLFKKVSHMLVN